MDDDVFGDVGRVADVGGEPVSPGMALDNGELFGLVALDPGDVDGDPPNNPVMSLLPLAPNPLMYPLL